MRPTHSTARRPILGIAATVLLTTSLAAQSATKPLPLKYVGPATTPAITAGDLMTRLYKYADDSMMGRDVGTPYHLKAVAYIESELRRLGLQPGGTNGSYYQDFPIWSTEVDKKSTITANGRTLVFAKDFLVVPGGTAPNLSLPVVYAGAPNDTSSMLDSAAVAGKILLNRSFPATFTPDQMASYRLSSSYKAYQRAALGAAARIQLLADTLPQVYIDAYASATKDMEEPVPGGPISITLIATPGVEAIFGAPLASLRRGQVSAPITIASRFVSTPTPPGRNVIGIIPGTDPKLKGQYVAIGAHSDHVGFDPMPVMREHDSLRVFNAVGIPAGAEGGRDTPLTPAEWARVNTDIAALRKVYPSRADSINNGADDDGSGTVSVLEIAEAFAKGTIKPKRSIIFVWHAGEEHGMWGSGYFMDHPTVPRDSIVAQLNIDMVGRGAAADVTGQGKTGGILHGGDRYLQLVGSRRLSTELGDLVEKVNSEKQHNFTFDYNIDADGHPQNIYCRSDHWSYAKWGVPVVFFTTGGHADYHQVTDEPQYIRYDHMSLIDKLIFDVADRVANLDHRPVVDKAKPNPAPATECKQ